MAERSKALVLGPSLPGDVGSNPTAVSSLLLFRVSHTQVMFHYFPRVWHIGHALLSDGRNCRQVKENEVPPRLELGSLDSKSRVLTITPWDQAAGPVRDLNPGPLAPEARIIPLDQRADRDGGGEWTPQTSHVSAFTGRPEPAKVGSASRENRTLDPQFTRLVL